MDEKDIELLTFTLERGNARFKDYMREFEKTRRWSHQSIMDRIGTEGKLQSEGWLLKELSADGKRPVYRIRPQRILSVRLLAYALLKKTDYRHHVHPANDLLRLQNSIASLGKHGIEADEAVQTLVRLNVGFHASEGVREEAITEAAVLLAKTIAGELKDPESGFTMVIDYSPRNVESTTKELIGTTIAQGILSGLAQGKQYQSLADVLKGNKSSETSEKV